MAAELKVLRELHDSQWRTDNCCGCSCSRDGIDCCSNFTTPTGCDERRYVSIFNKETCNGKVVEKDDHSEDAQSTKYLPLFCLILLFSRTLCDARCYFRPASKYGCLSNRNLYVFGAVWKTEDCYQCRCKMNAMICCSLVVIPKNYDRVNCVGLFHKKSCSIRVVKKTNPDISCKVYNGAD
ncbi:beta-microseminoprotein-like [Falco naumanni]|uniref:beta-microseminoprotein-like n=1 Tax=Falco naumanni TaxID=148594 RepID=UPI001ADE01B1|nr:beta-microseminoprotein-like [Falco naumanni]